MPRLRFHNRWLSRRVWARRRRASGLSCSDHEHQRARPSTAPAPTRFHHGSPSPPLVWMSTRIAIHAPVEGRQHPTARARLPLLPRTGSPRSPDRLSAYGGNEGTRTPSGPREGRGEAGAARSEARGEPCSINGMRLDRACSRMVLVGALVSVRCRTRGCRFWFQCVGWLARGKVVGVCCLHPHTRPA